MIYFTRHGQTDWNVARKIQGTTDIPLNAQGRAQALSLQAQIPPLNLSKIIASDLKRARETADILNEKTSIPIVDDGRIREFRLGSLEGQPVALLTGVVWRTLFENADFFDAESLLQVYARVRSFLDSLDPTENILVVTHAGILKMVAYCKTHPDKFDFEVFAKRYLNLWLKNATLYRWDEDWEQDIP